MKQDVLNLYKKCGETPLERLDRFKKEYPEYENDTLSYAGRLDPMAEGVLIALRGEENKKRDYYLNLPKVYETDILFGISTDTYDILGKIVSTNETQGDIRKSLENVLTEFRGEIVQKYPPYSSKTVQGKPLFSWAREGKLQDIEIPSHKVVISDIAIVGQYVLPARDLKKIVAEKISLVNGDFRQKEILGDWNNFFDKNDINRTFPVFSLRAEVSSGTYMREIANSLGEHLHCGAFALSIKRESVGDYRVVEAIK